jgi:hypothetical protein
LNAEQTPIGDQPKWGESAIAVTRHRPTLGQEDWRNLAQAFAAFVSGNYAALVIPANVAVESRLSRLLSNTLKLREIPNDLAHLGRLKTQVSKIEAAELLAGALFGFDSSLS